MLLYGNIDNVQNVSNCEIYNFCSLVEGLRDLGIMPPNSLGALNEYDFDIKYMHYIFDNDIIFTRFMTIILDLYYGKDVYLVISDLNDNWCALITESLMKLIQQRYGINAAYINSPEDIQYAKDSFFESYGIINLDIDRNRYIYLYESSRIAAGGKIYNE